VAGKGCEDHAVEAVAARATAPVRCSRYADAVHPRAHGIGYDGSWSTGAALQLARELANAGRGHDAHLKVAYVDDSAS
jgi:hypothetical protein